jgi:G:T-mismatch repair DNA endonuclease (very short patch repair protein)
VAKGWDVLVIWECEIRNKAGLQERLIEFLGKPSEVRCQS